MSLLADRVVLVSGVGPGLGQAVAVAAAEQGADVVLAARRAGRLEKVAAKVTGLGRRAVTVPTDITDPTAVSALVAAALEAFGRIDVLVNNAFIDGTRAEVLESDPDDWRRVIEVNLLGTLSVTRAVAAHMVDTALAGSIVMVNSMAMQRQEPGFGAYAASKSALASATRTLARELGPHGIRVNGVHPGYIWGPPVEWYLQHLAEEQGTTPDAVRGAIEAELCLHRIPTAAEVAGSVVFLASDLAAAVTGQAISANGGHHLAAP
jgi:NAD(P)-dependent dehydrogenase (short-subunit alcohol dehydrogenase family)